MWPRLTPRTGTPRSATSRAPHRRVPSPPIVIRRSTPFSSGALDFGPKGISWPQPLVEDHFRAMPREHGHRSGPGGVRGWPDPAGRPGPPGGRRLPDPRAECIRRSPEPAPAPGAWAPSPSLDSGGLMPSSGSLELGTGDHRSMHHPAHPGLDSRRVQFDLSEEFGPASVGDEIDRGSPWIPPGSPPLHRSASISRAR